MRIPPRAAVMNKDHNASTSRLHGLPATARTDIVAVANALEAGRQEDARQALDRLLAQSPDHPEVLRLLAGWRSMRGETDAAIAAMQRAVAQRPNDALYHNTLGSVLAQARSFDRAAQAFQRAIELQPDLANAWYNLALVWRQFGRHADAVNALQKAIALQPQHVYARVMLAESMKAEGRNADAEAEFRKVLATAPQAGMAWWSLADMKNVRMTAQDIHALRRAMALPQVGHDDWIAMGFALARAHEDQGDFPAALAALARANERARTRFRWDASAFSAQVDALLAAFATPTSSAAGPLGDGAIFIVGMPRSGTSLTEQILASHSRVEGAGELLDLPEVLAAETRRRGKGFPDWVVDASADDWQRLGREYLDRCAHWRGAGKLFTDKLPDNWRYIGAIRAMLPGARIIVCRRDPLETCLACYRQRLVEHEYTRTFADLAAYWRDFDRSVRHASSTNPDAVIESVYEDLIADPEAHIRRLLAFCALDFEPACLAFHTTERRVLTPSATQVREPLRSDTARAQRYGALIDPLRVALGLDAYRPQR